MGSTDACVGRQAASGQRHRWQQPGYGTSAGPWKTAALVMEGGTGDLGERLGTADIPFRYILMAHHSQSCSFSAFSP